MKGIMKEEKTYFFGDEDFAQIAQENPDYTKIYVNITTEDIKCDFNTHLVKKSIIKLSKDSGDILFAVSNTNYENIKDYFKVNSSKSNDTKTPIQEKSLDSVRQLTKTKPKTLEGFFKKAQN